MTQKQRELIDNMPDKHNNQYEAAAYEKRLYKEEMSTEAWSLKTICLQCGRRGLAEGKRCIIEGREFASHISHCNRQNCRDQYAVKLKIQLNEIRSAKKES